MLPGKQIMITGASRGIGRAAALLLASEGAQVILLARSLDQLEKLRDEIKSAGGNSLVYKADVSQAEAVSEVFEDLNRQKIYLDSLVNNAGIMKDAVIQMAGQDMTREIYETNVFGMMHVTRLAVKSILKKRGGSIVNMSSIVGVYGNLGQSVYASSKSAIIGYTKSLSKELASLQIRVNALAPGFIDTDMIKNMDSRFYERNLQSIGMKRIGTPEDVAKAILFLCSDLSSYVTGQIIGVDGGMVL